MASATASAWQFNENLSCHKLLNTLEIDV